jgi:lysophospholipase L1-like esterase
MTPYCLALLVFSMLASPLVGLSDAANAAHTPSFADFDLRAKAGERLNVVFFGASLTWGANASDPQLTSFRGLIAQRLEAAYPNARFHFWDAAIGGTGSQLGVFRLERDVLQRRPDLVFLDFTANDGISDATPETLASYESLVRRIIVEGHAPVVQVVFPFMWDVQRGKLDGLKRRDAHHKIAGAYHTAIGDAVQLCLQRVQSGATTLQKLWPFDGVHPGDAGYEVFADAGWQAFEEAVKAKQVCAAPPRSLYGETYGKNARIRISSLSPLPDGWHIGVPNPVSAYFDMLMSRWLNDEVIVARKKGQTNSAVPLKVEFSGSMVMLFGESTTKSVKYRAFIDGKLVEHKSGDGKQTMKEFDGGSLANLVKGNCHHAQVIVEGLDPAHEHTLEIQPLFTGEAEQELRLESICVAGGAAHVRLPATK